MHGQAILKRLEVSRKFVSLYQISKILEHILILSQIIKRHIDSTQNKAYKILFLYSNSNKVSQLAIWVFINIMWIV